MIRRLFALIAVLALVLSACASTGGETAAGGPSEGIQVHGNWTIDVLDPDGTLASHTEFENDLVSSGAEYLSRLLAGAVSEGFWLVSFGPPPSPCQVSAPCRILESGIVGGADSNNLIVEVIDTPPSTRLSGSVVAALDAVVSQVATLVEFCDDNTVAPADCIGPGTTSALFTFKTLDPADAVTVAAGQTIQVVVEISYS